MLGNVKKDNEYNTYHMCLDHGHNPEERQEPESQDGLGHDQLHGVQCPTSQALGALEGYWMVILLALGHHRHLCQIQIE
jgi:hypothetical protein